MFSTTTMASSTTKPTAMVSAISDRLSREKFIRYIAANEPASASGTVTLGMSVAQQIAQEQKDHHHHEADGEYQREFDVDHRGADGRGAVENGVDLDRRRDARGELRQLGLDPVDDVDDVGAGLLEDGKDDAVAGCSGSRRRCGRPAAATAWPTSRTRIGAPLR